MDTPEEAIDYDAMDHRAVNTLFVDDFLNLVEQAGQTDLFLSITATLQILDVGTGTAQIPIELCRREGCFEVVAIDLAAEMLKLTKHNIDSANFNARIIPELVDSKQLPYADESFFAVISNSIVHHIPEPVTAIAEMIRVLKPGGLFFVRDLHRPETVDELENLVNTYVGDENEHQQRMFRESLHAALTIPELHEILRQLNIPVEWAQKTTDRHWTIAGCHSL